MLNEYGAQLAVEGAAVDGRIMGDSAVVEGEDRAAQGNGASVGRSRVSGNNEVVKTEAAIGADGAAKGCFAASQCEVVDVAVDAHDWNVEQGKIRGGGVASYGEV